MNKNGRKTNCPGFSRTPQAKGQRSQDVPRPKRGQGWRSRRMVVSGFWQISNRLVTPCSPVGDGGFKCFAHSARSSCWNLFGCSFCILGCSGCLHFLVCLYCFDCLDCFLDCLDCLDCISFCICLGCLDWTHFLIGLLHGLFGSSWLFVVLFGICLGCLDCFHCFVWIALRSVWEVLILCILFWICLDGIELFWMFGLLFWNVWIVLIVFRAQPGIS